MGKTRINRVREAVEKMIGIYFLKLFQCFRRYQKTRLMPTQVIIGHYHFVITGILRLAS